MEVLKNETIEPPRMWKVLMKNDDETPKSFVLYILKKVFRYQLGEAMEKMDQVQKDGSSSVGSYPKSIAEAKRSEVMEEAKFFKYPLTVETEVEDV